MVNITLPDGSIKTFDDFPSGLDVALSISEGLARNCVAMELNGTLVDLNRSIAEDSSIRLTTTKDEEGLETIRSWVVLVLILTAEVVLTIIFPPSRGLPWPALRWLVPLASMALAVVVTTLVLRRRGDSLLFTTFFLFTTVHTFLQLAFYALI